MSVLQNKGIGLLYITRMRSISRTVNVNFFVSLAYLKLF